MNVYHYENYNTFLDDIVKGNYTINTPILNNNKKFSFLGNILNYSNIDKSNLHKILVNMINKVKNEIHSQDDNKLCEHVKNEWSLNDNVVFCDHNCGCMDNLHSHIKNKNDYENFIDKLEERFSEQKVYKTLLPECELKQYSNIELRNSVDDTKDKCKTILQSLDNDIDSIKSEKNKIDSINTNFLLDMSMKPDYLYNDIDNDITISSNIHNIYMNYVLLINLLKKHIYHIEEYYMNLKQQILSRCDNTSDLLNNLSCSELDNSFF